jgi:predicted Zn finger-like uncharacterized protein
MVLTCTCGAKLKISDEKITEAGVKIKCPKCGTTHIARKPEAASAPPAASAGMPWFASRPAAQTPVSSSARSAPHPAQTPPVSAAEPTMPWFAPSSGRPSSALVLVAHDSNVVVDMIRGVVSEAGLSVEHAPDGLDALKKATALKPQVMIVDVGLTGIYGFELCERLKGDPDTRGIKIILLSSVYGLTAYKRNPVTLYGADDYIEKHHIPDKLVPKIKQLLSGRSASSAGAPAASPAAEDPDRNMPAPRPQTVPPPVYEERPVSAALMAAAPPAAAAEAKRALQEVPDVMPKVPVTLDGSRNRTATPPPIIAPPKVETTSAPEPPRVPPATASAVPRGPEKPQVPMMDESVKLDATFFEQDEYIPPVKAPAKAPVDPQEVEKARRFARLVVSDIALYNQEAVADGIAQGTFYDLLKDDIVEGRALYEKRVPEDIRSTRDYFQEAFDNFIAAKKKQR